MNTNEWSRPARARSHAGVQILRHQYVSGRDVDVVRRHRKISGQLAFDAGREFVGILRVAVWIVDAERTAVRDCRTGGKHLVEQLAVDDRASRQERIGWQRAAGRAGIDAVLREVDRKGAGNRPVADDSRDLSDAR